MGKLLQEITSIRFAHAFSGASRHAPNPNAHGPAPLPNIPLLLEVEDFLLMVLGLLFNILIPSICRVTDPEIVFCSTAQNVKVSAAE